MGGWRCGSCTTAGRCCSPRSFGVAAWRPFETYRGLRGDLEELLPESAPSVGAIERVRARMYAQGTSASSSTREARRTFWQLKALLTARLRAALAPDERRYVDSALSDAALTPLSADRIPETLLVGLREHDGRSDRSVLVLSSDIVTAIETDGPRATVIAALGCCWCAC